MGLASYSGSSPAILPASSVKIRRTDGYSSISMTVQPLASAAGKASLFGIRAQTGSPAAFAKRATRSSSPGRLRALNRIPATRRPSLPSKFLMPRSMLLAA